MRRVIMTEDELLEAVDSYFEKHLESEYWAGLEH